MRTICLTGGTGFVGSHLLELLEQEPEVKVKVLSRKQADMPYHADHVQVFLGDLLDSNSLVRFLEPDSITINLAYMSNRLPEDNIEAGLNLARACAKVGVAHLIHVSSAVVVGRTAETVITEKTHCNPITRYERAKLEIEKALLSNLGSICKVSILRPTEVFGEGGRGLIHLTRNLMNGSTLINRLKLSLYGRRRLNLVYVGNVVAAIRFLMFTDREINKQCYIVSDDEAEENNYCDVVRLMTTCLGRTLPRTSYFKSPSSILSTILGIIGRSNTNPYRIYSCDKLLHLDFRKPVSFMEGLQRFADWYKRTIVGAEQV